MVGMQENTSQPTVPQKRWPYLLPLAATILSMVSSVTLYGWLLYNLFPMLSNWQFAGATTGLSILLSALIEYGLFRRHSLQIQQLRQQVHHHQQTEHDLTQRHHRTEILIAEQTTELELINEQLQATIAEQQRTAEALRDSEGQYRTLFESLQDVFYRTDLEGNLRLVSPSFVQILGYSQEEALHLNLRDDLFAQPERWAEFIRFIQENRYLEQFEILLKRYDSSRIWGSLTSQWYTDQSGRILGIEGILRDITDRKQAEEALQQRTTQLEMLRQVGLELAAQLELQDVLYSIASKAVEIVGGGEGGLYLYRPDRDILEWAVAVTPSPIPLGATLCRNEGAAGKVWATGQPMIVNDYATWEGRAINYDQYHFTTLVAVPFTWGAEFLGVLNVNGNASQTFTQADIDLLSLFAAQAAIAIRNARLYETERKRATQYQGSRFWFEASLPEAHSMLPAYQAVKPQPVGVKGGPYHVLIVDDDHDNRNVFRMLLEPLGFRITEAIHGQDALIKAQITPFHLILMDLVMPGMDGFETTRHLRQIPALRDVAIIAISANAFEHTRHQSLAAGCQAFLTKPLHIDTFLDCIASSLQLEWIYPAEHNAELPNPRASQDAAIGLSAALPVPPQATLMSLLELIRRGDLLSLPAYVSRMAEAGPQYAPFMTRVCQFAQAFQVDQLETFILQYVQTSLAPNMTEGEDYA